MRTRQGEWLSGNVDLLPLLSAKWVGPCSSISGQGYWGEVQLPFFVVAMRYWAALTNQLTLLTGQVLCLMSDSGYAWFI